MTRLEFKPKTKAQAFQRAYLAERLAYDAETGRLTWKVRPDHHFSSPHVAAIINSRNGGKPAGNLGQNGYIYVRVDGRLLLAHRIIWAMERGPIPIGAFVDHINRVTTDNRLENLRLVNVTQNAMNAGKKRDNGLPKNVHFDRRRGGYVVWVAAYRVRKYGGRFQTISEAEEVAKRLRQEMHEAFAHDGATDAA